ncbi:hypothetical protein V1478_011941 [Vespula squamosa]|uniref:Uncharacterized protein n=1 Tax=Vespula squamosa TaxID=30214 RepID=A0ABD2AC08_VESSQ
MRNITTHAIMNQIPRDQTRNRSKNVHSRRSKMCFLTKITNSYLIAFDDKNLPLGDRDNANR